MNRLKLAAFAGAILLLPGSFLLARAGWVRAKGAVGEMLIHRALAATLQDGRTRRPWSWADMQPVARLTVPRLGIERPVLSNATGQALAFGIGHVDGTAMPAAAGNCVLAGHRDSWAAFLSDLRVGDAVVIEAPERRSAYRVGSTSVVTFNDARVLRDEGDDRLTLVTCWPFRGWLHSPWRYVVRCERVPFDHGQAFTTSLSRPLRRNPNVPTPQEFLPRARYQNAFPNAGRLGSLAVGVEVAATHAP
jgi:sortase A